MALLSTESLQRIEREAAKYPPEQRQSAVMSALAIAQDQHHVLTNEVMEEVATVLRMPTFRPLSLMNHNRGVFGLNLGHLWSEARQLASAMDTLLSEFDAGRLQPIVARTFPLERAADAHRFVQSRSNIGKVVLTCAQP